jgi:anti-sigma regulatory factor (Ser/Thr protein kinase)
MPLLKLSLKLKDQLEDLEILNKTLGFLSSLAGMSKKCSCEFNLVIEELFTNIVRHGCCDGNKHIIYIIMSLEEEFLTVRIVDDCTPFNPIKATNPDCTSPPEDRKIGGLGIFLARNYTEDIRYKRCGKKNTLILKKKIISMPK